MAGNQELPLASCERHARAFVRLGWEIKSRRRGKGSHILLEKEGAVPLTIPGHREVKRSVLATLIAQGGHTHEEYLRAFR